MVTVTGRRRDANRGTDQVPDINIPRVGPLATNLPGGISVVV